MRSCTVNWNEKGFLVLQNTILMKNSRESSLQPLLFLLPSLWRHKGWLLQISSLGAVTTEGKVNKSKTRSSGGGRQFTFFLPAWALLKHQALRLASHISTQMGWIVLHVYKSLDSWLQVGERERERSRSLILLRKLLWKQHSSFKIHTFLTSRYSTLVFRVSEYKIWLFVRFWIMQNHHIIRKKKSYYEPLQ